MAQTLPSLVSNLWWNIVTHLVSDNNCNTINLQSPNIQGMTNNVGLIFNVGDCAAVYNHYWTKQLEFLALNIIFSVD